MVDVAGPANVHALGYVAIEILSILLTIFYGLSVSKKSSTYLRVLRYSSLQYTYQYLKLVVRRFG